MIRGFDKRYRGDHPTLDFSECCEMCKKKLGPKECLYELGKLYVCVDCLERREDSLEREYDYHEEMTRRGGGNQ